MKIFILAAAITGLAAAPARAEYGLAAGGVGFSGFGAFGYYQPEGSGWRFGAEYGTAGGVSRDKAGRELSRDEEAMRGFFVQRQFTPGGEGRWYAAAALLRWTRREKAAAGDSAAGSDLSPYFGLGWLRRFGGRWFADLGVLAAPWARLDIPTSAGPGRSRGAADLHAALGLRF